MKDFVAIHWSSRASPLTKIDKSRQKMAAQIQVGGGSSHKLTTLAWLFHPTKVFATPCASKQGPCSCTFVFNDRASHKAQIQLTNSFLGKRIPCC